MTPKLLVTGGPNRGQEVALTGRIIFNIGSDRGSTVFLDDSRVAPNHCRLYNEESKFTLFDVSGKGMQVNGKRVVKSVLNDGDLIALGDSQLRFSLRDHAGQGSSGFAPVAAPAYGQPGPPSASAGYPQQQPYGAPAQAPAGGGSARDDFRMNLAQGRSKYARVWAQCVEGNDKGKIFDLSEGNCWVIGRGHSADITVMDIKVSRAHTRIEREGDNFYCVDLNSTNGSFVNGQQVDRQELHRGDYVKTGYTILCFQYETVEEAQAAGRGAPPRLDAAAVAGLRDDAFGDQIGSGRQGLPGAPPGLGVPPQGPTPAGVPGVGHPGHGVPPGYGAPPPGYGLAPPGYGAPPPGYGAPPPGGPPGFGGPPGYQGFPQGASPYGPTAGVPPYGAPAPGQPGSGGYPAPPPGPQYPPQGPGGYPPPGGPQPGSGHHAPPPGAGAGYGQGGPGGAGPFGAGSAALPPYGAGPVGAGSAAFAPRAPAPQPSRPGTAPQLSFDNMELNFDALDDGSGGGDPFAAQAGAASSATASRPGPAGGGNPAGAPRGKMLTSDLMVPDDAGGLFDDPGLGSTGIRHGAAPAAGQRCLLCNEAYPAEAIAQGALTEIQGNYYCRRCLQR